MFFSLWRNQARFKQLFDPGCQCRLVDPNGHGRHRDGDSTEPPEVVALSATHRGLNEGRFGKRVRGRQGVPGERRPKLPFALEIYGRQQCGPPLNPDAHGFTVRFREAVQP